MAGDLSLAQRATVEARFAYEQAAALALEVGDREAAERLARKAEHIMDNAGPSADQPLPESVLEEWRELLVETVIPAPSAAVAIGGPASDPAPGLEIQLEEGLDLVTLAAPPEPGLTEIGSAGVILPAPVLSLELEAPAEAPDLTDARVKAPELRQADMRLTAVRARDLPVSSLTVVPIPAPAAVRVAAPEVEPAQELEELRIDAPELREPPLPALPRL